MSHFDDVLEANAAYQKGFDLGDLEGRASKGLAVVTCIDTRIEPLAMLGLRPGDAKIMRNAGGRVTDDALRSLILAVHLLGVRRVAVVHHTNCKMASASDAEIRAELAALTGKDLSGFEPLALIDPAQGLDEDVAKVRECPLLPDDLVVGGFVYDVRSGSLTLIEE